MRESPDMASMVMRSSGSSRSSMPASMALRMVVEKWETYRVYNERPVMYTMYSERLNMYMYMYMFLNER